MNKILILNQSGILQSRFYLACPWYLCYPLVRVGSPTPSSIFTLRHLPSQMNFYFRISCSKSCNGTEFSQARILIQIKMMDSIPNSCNRITILTITLSFPTVSMVNLTQCLGNFTLSNAMNKFFVHFYVLSHQEWPQVFSLARKTLNHN